MINITDKGKTFYATRRHPWYHPSRIASVPPRSLLRSDKYLHLVDYLLGWNLHGALGGILTKCDAVSERIAESNNAKAGVPQETALCMQSESVFGFEAIEILLRLPWPKSGYPAFSCYLWVDDKTKQHMAPLRTFGWSWFLRIEVARWGNKRGRMGGDLS
jgi:hypothetical protein